jgi:predicted  nucleic acid-binding Zn-ribbon protein
MQPGPNTIAKLMAEIDDWRADLKALEAQMRELGPQNVVEYRRVVDDLRATHEKLREKLDEFADLDDPSVVELEQTLHQATRGLKEAVKGFKAGGRA